MAKPKNRFDVQVLFDGGGYMRDVSRKDVVLTRADVLRCLKEIVARIERYDARKQAVAKDGGGTEHVDDPNLPAAESQI
jgi:hypothetical protein